MAYKTVRRGARSYTRKRSYKPRYNSTGRKRTYRRTRRTYRPKMTKKRVLNVSSTKKRDTMAARTNTDAVGGTLPATPNPVRQAGLTLAASSASSITMYMPCARDMDPQNTKGVRSARSNTTCYMVGYGENIRVTTNSGVPWMWRRICFTLKGTALNARSSETPTIPNPFFREDTQGFTRTMIELSRNANDPQLARISAILFQGAQGVDWTNVITAPVDTTRVTLKHDSKLSIASGNANGVTRVYKRWYPMRKNIVYDDEETGNAENSSYVSTQGKAGMGDYYIADIFQPGVGGGANDLLYIEPTGTIYWHEK